MHLFAINPNFRRFGRGGGQVVSVLALYSNDLSLQFYTSNCLEITKINELAIIIVSYFTTEAGLKFFI